MPDRSYELHGVRIFECATEGALLRSDRDAADLLPTAWSHHAAMIVIPVERLAEDFFELKTRVAGEIIQKLVIYHMRVAIDRKSTRLNSSPLPDALPIYAAMIVIPVERLAEDFFELKTRVAGEIIQKLVIYHMRVAIVGEISQYLAKSPALRD